MATTNIDMVNSKLPTTSAKTLPSSDTEPPTADVEAQQILDGLADKPEVCQALYGLLQDKYEEGESNKDEGGPPSEYSDEGLPKD